MVFTDNQLINQSRSWWRVICQFKETNCRRGPFM